MDEQRRLKVAKLAQAESRARQRYEALGRMNTWGLTVSQREAMDTEYAVALADWRDALEALQAEVGTTPRVHGIRVIVDPNMPPDCFRLFS